MVKQVGNTTAIIMTFIGLIVAIVFMQSVGDSIFTQTNTFSIANETITAPAVNASTALTGRDFISDAIVTNSTTGTIIPTANLTISDTNINGAKTVVLTTNDAGSSNAGESVNVSYIYGASGYLSDSGSRGITTLILIFAALAAMVFTIVSFMQTDFGKMMRNK